MLACFAILPNALAVVPPPDGGYPGGNTAEGQNALLNLTTGGFNTALGFFSLRSNITGSFNTGVGAGTLFANTGDLNTATGVGALLSNTIGASNTASGAFALFNNTAGGTNTATGVNALFNNTTGNQNTATGYAALAGNTTGDDNTAYGVSALASNTIGGLNTAVGFFALSENTDGNGNTAVGYEALLVSSGSENTAVGDNALGFNTGNGNTALGFSAGVGLSTGDNNIDIGHNVSGGAGESNTIRIGDTDITDTFISGISGTTVAGGAAVLVDSNGHLGTLTSSKRFKEEIKSMDKASEALLALKPVTFRYTKEIDPHRTPQLGLVAEDVEKVNPDLVVRDKGGKPYSVRCEQVNAMLLNEFLKEHKAFVEEQRKVQEQGAAIARLEKQIDVLTARLQKVSAQFELNKAAPQTVLNNQ